MKRNKMKLCRAVALLLSILALLSCLIGCSSTGKTMMELDDSKISVNLFRLFLSRMKGSLCSSYSFGAEALQDSFWNKIMSVDGTTYNDYYTNTVLENTKTYLAALYVFEQKGLELPKSYVEEIDAELERLIEQDADGSKSKFNSMLSEYGANYKVLREAYLIEAKISYLNDMMFGSDGSLIAENLIEDYYEQTYARFKQVFLYTYDYVYETDGDGQDIYYKENGKISYDTSATAKVGGNGAPVYDKNGDRIYVTEDGRVAYDKKNGTRTNVLDSDGNKVIDQLPEAELNQTKADAAQIFEQAVKGDYDGFDKLVTKYSEDTGMEKYPNGYYMTATTSYDSPEVVEKLFQMEVGDVAQVSSEYGIHIFMRYDLEEEGYKKEENSDFFISTTNSNYVFMTDLKNKLLSDYLEPFKEQILLDESVFAQADIKSVGANFYY
ncbi:MAG: peptidylprolyl isomerase [Clostridia bacterium]|nr:peptidylprolyl isomerase [Clostridia bacterium]